MQCFLLSHGPLRDFFELKSGCVNATNGETGREDLTTDLRQNEPLFASRDRYSQDDEMDTRFSFAMFGIQTCHNGSDR